MTLEQFKELLEIVDDNWPKDAWSWKEGENDEWWVLIKHVDYHRFIREDNQTSIKIEHDKGRTLWLEMGNSEFSCSYNHHFDKMLCLIIKREEGDN